MKLPNASFLVEHTGKGPLFHVIDDRTKAPAAQERLATYGTKEEAQAHVERLKGAKVFKAHPSIDFPEWLSALGFEDESWVNDECARATLSLKNGMTLVVWCSEEDPADRGIGGPHFQVSVEPKDGYGSEDGEDIRAQTDNVDEVIAAIKAAIEQTKE